MADVAVDSFQAWVDDHPDQVRRRNLTRLSTSDLDKAWWYDPRTGRFLSPDPMAHHPTYFSLVRDILSTVPSAWPFIEGINNHILNGDPYYALKEAKKLIDHEGKLIEDAKDLRAARANIETNRKSA